MQEVDLMRGRISIGAIAAGLAISSYSASAQEKIGIAICDEFLAKYDACGKDKPVAQRSDKLHQTIAEQRANWSAKAKDLQFRQTVETSCKLAVASFETSLSYPPNNCKM